MAMWVLNVDDDLDDCEMFCDAIHEINPRIDCVTRNCAEDALNLLNITNTLPEYIFLDINMPRMDGIECLKTIKRNNRLADIPVIILSTTRNHNEIADVKKLGADFLAKESGYRKFVSSIKSKISHNLA
jgi:DNA-binding response OmpR family regulator